MQNMKLIDGGSSIGPYVNTCFVNAILAALRVYYPTNNENLCDDYTEDMKIKVLLCLRNKESSEMICGTDDFARNKVAKLMLGNMLDVRSVQLWYVDKWSIRHKYEKVQTGAVNALLDIDICLNMTERHWYAVHPTYDIMRNTWTRQLVRHRVVKKQLIEMDRQIDLALN
jgi:hypothetical protein